MDRVRLSSRNLLSVGYDAHRCVLEIEFIGRTVYQYADVPASVHARLMAAASKETFFDHHIRDRYRFKRVR